MKKKNTFLIHLNLKRISNAFVESIFNTIILANKNYLFYGKN